MLSTEDKLVGVNLRRGYWGPSEQEMLVRQPGKDSGPQGTSLTVSYFVTVPV